MPTSNVTLSLLTDQVSVPLAQRFAHTRMGDPRVFAYIANSTCPAPILASIIEQSAVSPKAVMLLVHHPNLPSESINLLLEKIIERIRQIRGVNPAELMEARDTLLKRPEVSPTLLENLAKRSGRLSAAIMQNPNCSPQLRQKLLMSQSPNRLADYISHGSCTVEEVTEIMQQHPQRDILQAIVKWDFTPAEWLSHIAIRILSAESYTQDPYSLQMLHDIYKHPNTPSEISQLLHQYAHILNLPTQPRIKANNLQPVN